MTQLKANATEDLGRVIYTAKTHTIGGRENGVSRSSDGRLDVKISPPGSSRIGTNPEQLFAAGWSACFESALGLAARKRKVTLACQDKLRELSSKLLPKMCQVFVFLDESSLPARVSESPKSSVLSVVNAIGAHRGRGEIDHAGVHRH